MSKGSVDEPRKSATEEALRKRVEDCRIFLQNTRSFPPRRAASDEYAKAVQELDHFLSPRHRCIIYEGPSASQLSGLAAVTVEQLEANNRCLFLNSPAMATEFRSSLEAAGLDVAREEEKGALVVSSDQSHLWDGRFDVDRMLGSLNEAVNQALKDGYRALWATGDMMWELGGERNFEKLLEYELRLEEFIGLRPELSGICQYDRTTIPRGGIETALHAHRTVYVNDMLSRTNPFHMRADILRGQGQSSGEHVDEMLRELQDQ
jgi:MEDS: MEthanogen/methylotroph, DcmR Sensory domain